MGLGGGLTENVPFLGLEKYKYSLQPTPRIRVYYVYLLRNYKRYEIYIIYICIYIYYIRYLYYIFILTASHSFGQTRFY